MTHYPEMAVASPQSSGLGTTAWIMELKIAKDRRRVSYRGEIVDEGDLCLCEVTHIRVADLKRMLAPLVDLGRGRSPENIIEQYISKTALRKCGVDPVTKCLRRRIECRRIDRRGKESMWELFGPKNTTLVFQMTNSGL